MPTREIEIPFPLRGRVDGYSLEEQPPRATVSCLNVRGVDPATGRLRGAQRSGHRKLVSDLAGGFVQDIRSLNFDAQLVTWTLLDGAGGGNPTFAWSKEGTSISECRDLVVTRGGDVYAVAGGTAIDKFNSDGTRIYSVTPPLTSFSFVITALALDDEDNLYVATGNAQASTGQLFRYELNEAGELDLLWSVDLEGAVADIKHYAALLYVVVNGGTSSTINVYTGLASDNGPAVVRTRPVPEPCNRIAVDTGGNVFFASEANANRGQGTLGSFCGTKTVDWTPDEIGSAMKWAWLRADTILNKAENQEVDVWFDEWSGNRNLFAGTGASQGAPRYTADALCGKPGLVFDGSTSHMTSAIGEGSESASSRSIIPGVNNDAFVTVVACVPDRAVSGSILRQGGDFDMAIVSNPDPAEQEIQFTSTRAPTADVEAIGYSVDGATTGPNVGDVAICTVVHAGDDVAAASSWRCNGFESTNTKFAFNRERTAGATNIGHFPSVTTHGYFSGKILEIITVFLADKSGHPGTTDLDDIAEKIEGYLAHKFGVQNVLKSTATAHAYSATAPSGSGETLDTADAELEKLKSTDAVTGKFSPNLDTLYWAETGSGVGLDVVVDSDGGVYTAGLTDATGDAPLNVTVRKLIDGGSTVSETSPAWTKSLTLTDTKVRMAVDRGGNLYFPSAASNAVIKILDGGASTLTIALPNTHDGICVAIDRRTANSDYGGASITEPEFIFVGSSGSFGQPTVHKIRLVGSEAQVGAPRGTTVLRVAEGNIEKVNIELDTVTAITGGTAALNAESRIVRSAVLNQQIFYIDGDVRVYYDSITDEVSTWAAAGGGTLPTRPRLMVAWAGSIVFARCQGEPQNVYIGEQGNPFGWDLFPAVPTSTSASKLTINRSEDSAGFGGVPDVVNCLIPVSDDLLVIGCDSSIWRLTGNPFDGGRLDNIPMGGMGIAFGEPWCLGPGGELYFMGSRGGIYVVPVGGVSPILLTQDSLHRQLRDIDFDVFTARLVWDDEQQGVMVYIIPIDVVDPTGGGGGPGVFQFSTSSVTRHKNEGDSGTTTVILQVERAGGDGSAATVTYDITEYASAVFPATATTDFTEVIDGTVVFSSGENLKTITVSIVGDTDAEASETFKVLIKSVDSGGTLGDRTQSLITIINDDGSLVGVVDPTENPDYGGGGGPVLLQAAEDGTPQTHYLYEKRTKAWWPDQFGLVALDPTCVSVIDSDDPDDRRVVLGCADGATRIIDRTAKDDDGTAINSHTLIGPVMPSSLSSKHRFSNIRPVFSPESDLVTIEIFAADTAEQPEFATAVTTATAGRRKAWRKRFRGQSVWVRISNSNPGEHWAFEGMAMSVAPAGRVRV